MAITYQKNFKGEVFQLDEAGFWSVVNDPKVEHCIQMFRKTGDPRWKRKLPGAIFQASGFDRTKSPAGVEGCWRKQSAVHLNGICVIDVDHVDDVDALLKRLDAEVDFKAQGILLIYVTPSGNGVKIVFIANSDRGNLSDNQHEMGKILGVTVDEACKDASRLSFLCSAKDIHYLDSALFTYENPEYAAKYEEAYHQGRSGSEKTEEEVLSSAEENLKQRVKNGIQRMFNGIALTEIIKKWWQEHGGEPKEGERNVKLHRLAAHLRTICDNNEETLLAVLPRYGLDEAEMKNIVHSACKEVPKGVTREMKKTLDSFTAEKSFTGDINDLLEYFGGKIEEMFTIYPILKNICIGTKRTQYPAVVAAASTIMGTLMTDCHYHYYFQPDEKRFLNYLTVIIGDPTSGKSFLTRLRKYLAAPIIHADKSGIKAINKWRQEARTKGANSEKNPMPQPTIIEHSARCSNAQFIRDMVNAEQDHLLTIESELDNAISQMSMGAWADKLGLMLKAFHNEYDGQQYANIDSVYGNFPVFWNFLATGTPLALKKMVNDKNFGNGLATRLCCIPLPSTNFEMCGREFENDKANQRLRQSAQQLAKLAGELPIEKLVEHQYEWTARRMEDAKEANSKAMEMLLKRCGYYGLHLSLPFILDRHICACEVWTDDIIDTICREMQFLDEDEVGAKFAPVLHFVDEYDIQLCELFTNLQYACQKHFFGAMAERYFEKTAADASVNMLRKSKTYEAFEKLPKKFTVDDVKRAFHLDKSSAAHMRIQRLMADNLVKKAGTFVANGTTKARYKKTGVAML